MISGGAGGIGYATAQAFSVAGASTIVIFTRRQTALDEAKASLDAENSAAGRKTQVWTYQLDIQNAEATQSAFASIRQRLNKGEEGDEKDVDIIVCNAAALAQGSATLDFDMEVYRNAFATNVIGNLNFVRAFLAPEASAIPFVAIDGQVKQTTSLTYPSRKKTILDVSTVAPLTDFPGTAPYSASKLAFTSIMRTLYTEASKLKDSPIRIHSFNPGVIKTPGTKDLLDVDALDLPWVDVSLAAHFAVWLASPAAAFTSGRFMVSNWDVEELLAEEERFAAEPDLCSLVLNLRSVLVF